jgi:hypothetical protein
MPNAADDEFRRHLPAEEAALAALMDQQAADEELERFVAALNEPLPVLDQEAADKELERFVAALNEPLAVPDEADIELDRFLEALEEAEMEFFTGLKLEEPPQPPEEEGGE